MLETVPADVAKRVTGELDIPTVGIGAGPDCDVQVLVWQDMAGLRPDPVPRFVKRYADLRSILAQAAGFRRGRPDRLLPGTRAQLLVGPVGLPVRSFSTRTDDVPSRRTD